MSTHDQFIAELTLRLDTASLVPTRVWPVSGYTGHEFGSDKDGARRFVYVSTAKKPGPRWITTSVAIPGREPKQKNGKVRSMFKSDDIEAIQLMIAGLSSKPEAPVPQPHVNSLLIECTEEELDVLAPLS